MKDMKYIVDKLISQDKTIATMESCTGGALVNEITNVIGASEILKFSAVTYSNEYKIKMGVDEKIIKEYSVYSIECAKNMSKSISDFTGSNYGIGITGKINRIDKNNIFGNDNLIYVSIYDRDNDRYYTMSIDTIMANRKDNKKMIIDNIITLLNTII